MKAGVEDWLERSNPTPAGEARTFTVEELRALLRESRGLRVALEHEVRLALMLEQAEQCRHLVHGQRNSQIHIDQLRRLLGNAHEMSLSSMETNELQRKLDVAEDWLNTVRRTFVKKDQPAVEAYGRAPLFFSRARADGSPRARADAEGVPRRVSPEAFSTAALPAPRAFAVGVHREVVC